MPASRMATISSEVATGRKMNGRDGFTGRCSAPSPWPPPAALPLQRRLDNHLGARLQLVQSVGHQEFARRHPGIKRDHVALGRADRDRTQSTVRSGLTTYTNVPCGFLWTAAAGANRVSRDRVHQQLDVDKLVGEQRHVIVRKDRLQLNRSGTLIDLVVERLQRAYSKSCLEFAVEGIDGQLLPDFLCPSLPVAGCPPEC